MAKGAAAPARIDPTADESKSPAPDIHSIPRLAPKATKIMALVSQLSALTIRESAIADQKSDLKRQLMVHLSRADVERVKVQDHSLAICTTTRRTLNKRRLIEEGVDPDTIEKCTDVSTGAPYLRISGPRAEKEDGSGGD